MLNAKGEVVGIVTGLANPSGAQFLCRHRIRRAHRHGRPDRRRPIEVSAGSKLGPEGPESPEAKFEALLYHVKRVIVGQDDLLEKRWSPS